MRRLARALAALLAALVVVQTADLVVCADEAEAAAHAGEAQAAPGGGRAPAPADPHGHDESAPADCLCHVVFAPMAAVPTGEAVRAPEPARFWTSTALPPEVEPSGLDPVPWG